MKYEDMVKSSLNKKGTQSCHFPSTNRHMLLFSQPNECVCICVCVVCVCVCSAPVVQRVCAAGQRQDTENFSLLLYHSFAKPLLPTCTIYHLPHVLSSLLCFARLSPSSTALPIDCGVAPAAAPAEPSHRPLRTGTSPSS